MPRIFRHQVRQKSVTIVVICVFLATITWLVFGQTLGHGFVNYDDPQCVYDNVEVTSGLTLHGVTWAFTHSHFNNWHPLTWLTHMLDWQLYERKAGGHHMTNLLLHTAGVLLLFLVLAQMTGALWRSAFVAAIFAIHPLHVESVAWIAERKDVLSGVFFMLTLGAYIRYVRRQTLGRYAVVWILFACGLMCKPMLVTLPFVLLLLDYWPLNRVANHRLGVGSRGSGVSKSAAFTRLQRARLVTGWPSHIGKSPFASAVCGLLCCYFSRSRERDRFDLAVAVLVAAE